MGIKNKETGTAAVIPGGGPPARLRASSTRYGREPEIQTDRDCLLYWIPGSALRAAPE